MSIYFFINFKHVKISQNNQKCIKKHIAIFLGIFARKLGRTGVQVARTEVCIAKTQEKLKENKAHGYEAQTHAVWWIRISRMPQRRWINPDPLRPRSNGQKRRKAGSGLNRPGPAPIQKEKGLVRSHFFLSFLFHLSSSPLLSLLPTMNPNPNLDLYYPESNQTWFKRFVLLFQTRIHH